MTRTCPQCEREFTPKRPHAVVCSDPCRYQHWVEQAVEAGRQRVKDGSGSGLRRASRDGKGTRVYLTFGEIDHLEQMRGRAQLPKTPAGERLLAKFARAHERIAEGLLRWPYWGDDS
jgi:hypothetical protein